MKIIRSINDILAACEPEIVEISGWKPDQKWQVALERPSLVNMATDGSVPNPLLATVAKLLAGGTTAVKAGNEAEANTALKHIVRAAMKEPTMEALEKAGVALTDDQYMEIYAWVLGGLKGLDRFRSVARNGTGANDAADAGAAQRDAGNRGQLGGLVRGRSSDGAVAGAEEGPTADTPKDKG